MEVHRQLGPGLLEATYEEAMCLELTDEGVSFIRQTGVPIYYKGHLIGEHRPDLVVEDRVVEPRCVVKSGGGWTVAGVG
jgi:GxxExxY protein